MAFETEIDVLIKGPEGPEGPKGDEGEGVPGPAGNSILSGESTPSSELGRNGDFYINIADGILFGPKTFNLWGDGVPLKGPAGRSLLSGVVNPISSVGNVGDFYINVATNFLFGPKDEAGWPSGVSLVGPQGEQGEQGEQGLQGNTGTGDLTALTVGESVMARRQEDATANITMPSGTLRLGYFTSTKNEVKSSIKVYCQTGGGAPTLTKFGLYSVDGSGNLTLIGSTASDTTLLRTNATTYTKALQAAVSTVAGTRYAVAILVVTGSSVPSVSGKQGHANQFNAEPRLSASLNSQTDLPASIAVGSLVDSVSCIQATVLP